MKPIHTRHAVWRSVDSPHGGMETAWLEKDSAAGTILRFDDDGIPFQVSYRFQWASDFTMKVATIESTWNGRFTRVDLAHQATWKIGERELQGCERCSDVDLWPSALTNTFAIRRLKLGPHESRAIQTVYVEGPSLKVSVQRQIYTRLREHVYRFESPDADFSAEIQTDAEGLVTKYEGLFKRDL